MKSRMSSMLWIWIILSLCLWGPVLSAAAESPAPDSKQVKAALPEELKGITLEAYSPGAGQPAGTIQTVVGRVIVARSGLKEGYVAAPGNRLYRRDTVFTLKQSRCRLKLDGEDVVTMGESTRIELRSFSEDKASGKKSSVFNMAKGKAMFYALKLLRHRAVDMKVETPTAVLGVRGTKFGVDITTPQGNQSLTLVHGFGGLLEVLSKIDRISRMIGSGQTVAVSEKGAGEVYATPPGMAREFIHMTDTPAPSGGLSSPAMTPSVDAKTAEQPQAPGNSTSSSSSDPLHSSLLTPDTSKIAQDQNPPAVPQDPVIDPGMNSTAAKVGYTAALLTNVTSGTLEEMFISMKSQDPESSVFLRGHKDPARDHLRGEGGWGGIPYFRWAVFGAGTKSSRALGDTEYPITSISLGKTHDDVQEWGYWTQPKAFTVGDSSYMVDNKAYDIWGKDRPDASKLSFSAMYGGDAYGTYWNGTGGIDMKGAFACDVNFANGNISSLTMAVTSADAALSGKVSGAAPPASALIQNASGQIASDGTFEIAGGNWLLNGSAPDVKKAYGFFSGAGAEYIGGAWGMYRSDGTGAVGIYRGDKYQIPVDPLTDPGDNTTSVKAGYATAMLTNVADGSLEELFMSTKLQDPDSDVWMRGHKDPALDYMRGYGQAGATTPYLGWTVFGGGARTAALGTTYPLTTARLGENNMLEWGYWLQPAPFSALSVDTATTYAVNNKAYYVWGKERPDPSGLSFSAAYSGPAYGTYWTSAGGIDMTGTFSGQVAFSAGAGTVSGFSMNVSGLSASASIADASGTIDSTATFQLSGGNWLLNGATPDNYRSQGFFSGAGAEYMGGVWTMYDSAKAVGAAGIYAGHKPIHSGYYVMMLSDVTSDTNNLFNSFLMSGPGIPGGHQNLDSTNSAGDPFGGNASMELNASGDFKKSVITALNAQGESMTTGVPAQIQNTDLGSNAYMEWGEWIQPLAMSNGDGGVFTFNNKGYWIAGDVTSDSRMADLANSAITASYTGAAGGTFFESPTGSGGIAMTGTFGCDVNFGAASNQIANFNMSVEGSGRTASISGGAGSFSPAAGHRSNFAITSASSVTIQGMTAQQATAGAVYGPNAEAIGGVWAIKSYSTAPGYRAAGFFQGTKSLPK